MIKSQTARKSTTVHSKFLADALSRQRNGHAKIDDQTRPSQGLVSSQILVSSQAPPDSHTGSANSSPAVRPETKRQLLKVKLRRSVLENAVREIRKYQSSHDLLIPQAPFKRLVRELADTHSSAEVRFQPDAILALQEATECFITELLEHANKLALHAHRLTIRPPDLQLAVEAHKLDSKSKLWNMTMWREFCIATQQSSMQTQIVIEKQRF